MGGHGEHLGKRVILRFVQTPTLCHQFEDSSPHMQDVRGRLPLGTGATSWRLDSMDFSARLVCPRNFMSNKGVLRALHCAILWIRCLRSSGHVDVRWTVCVRVRLRTSCLPRSQALACLALPFDANTLRG